MLKGLLNKIARKVVAFTESPITKDEKEVHVLTNTKSNSNDCARETALTLDEEEIERRKALIEQQTGSKFYEQRKTEVKKTAGLDTYEDDRNVYKESINANNVISSFNKADWKDLQRNHSEVISAHLTRLRDTLFAGCVEDIFELKEEDFRTELLQLYLLNLKIQEGTYHQELDNLDSLSREEIKQAIFEISLNSYKERLSAKGFEYEPSLKQYEILKKNGIDVTKVFTRKKARQLLDNIFANIDNSVSEKQASAIGKLVNELGLSSKDFEPADRAEATKMIGQLVEIKKEVAYTEPASDKQKETYKNALKRNKMRMTPKREKWLETVSKGELSDTINELFEKYNKEHPNASEGQVNYICSMIDTINLGRPFDNKIHYNKEDMYANLTREKASEMIDTLSRDYLFIKTRITCPSMTREEIGSMSRTQVKDLLNSINNENKTRNYTVDSFTGDKVEKTIKY